MFRAGRARNNRRMTLLTRDALGAADFLDSLGLPPERRWSREAIADSLADTLRQRPPGPVWVFAYGSLLWNPLLEIEASAVALLPGWHRSFCLRLEAGRACQDRPGRMLALEPGGSTQGMALRLPEDRLGHELALLWTREMVTGAYHPRWLAARAADGQPLPVLAFVADPGGQGYEADASVATVAPCIAAACGPIGSNIDYVHRLAAALRQAGLRDAYVEQLAAALPAASPA